MPRKTEDDAHEVLGLTVDSIVLKLRQGLISGEVDVQAVNAALTFAKQNNITVQPTGSKMVTSLRNALAQLDAKQAPYED